MKKPFILTLVAALAFACIACSYTTHHSAKSIKPSANFVTKTCKVGDFSQAEIAGPFDVTYTEGVAASATVVAPDNVMPYIQVATSGKQLTVNFAPDSPGFNGNVDIKVTLSSQSLSRLSLSGAADFESDGISSPGFKLRASGASDFEADRLDTGNAEFTLSGASEAKIKNMKAATVSLTASGASEYDINGLKADNLTVSLSGASEADLENVNIGQANLSASGASEIKMEGACANVTKSATGAAKIDIRY